MADGTHIEWADATWNPITGCAVVSPGCTNCYAMRHAARMERMLPPERRGDAVLPNHYAALTKPSKAGPVWTGRVNIAPYHIITKPLRWRKPKRIFVNSMGDLFHESILDAWIDLVFAVMALAPQHQFLVLTKRPERMQNYTRNPATPERIAKAGAHMENAKGFDGDITESAIWDAGWPLPNVWKGVSVEDQPRADERIPILLDTPAAVRWISAEPLLGAVDLRVYMPNALWNNLASWKQPELDWIVAGGESGPGARPCHPDWARSLRDQCAAAGVPFFWKQWGEWAPHRARPGGDEGGDLRRGYVRYLQGDGREPDGHFRKGDGAVARVGKRAAGRLLDGRTHDAFPKVTR
jgi:protein gp37